VRETACLAAATIGNERTLSRCVRRRHQLPADCTDSSSLEPNHGGDARKGVKGVQGIDIGRIHIGGCGAVDQAAVLALRASRVSGTVVAVGSIETDI
jgi:hypothetical protein